MIASNIKSGVNIFGVIGSARTLSRFPDMTTPVHIFEKAATIKCVKYYTTTSSVLPYQFAANETLAPSSTYSGPLNVIRVTGYTKQAFGDDSAALDLSSVSWTNVGQFAGANISKR